MAYRRRCSGLLRPSTFIYGVFIYSILTLTNLILIKTLPQDDDPVSHEKRQEEWWRWINDTDGRLSNEFRQTTNARHTENIKIVPLHHDGSTLTKVRNRETYLFTAYYVDSMKEQKHVRVLGFALLSATEDRGLCCWLKETELGDWNTRGRYRKENIRIRHRNQDRKYHEHFFICDIPGDLGYIPRFIGITDISECTTAKTPLDMSILPVVNTENYDISEQTTFTTCITGVFKMEKIFPLLNAIENNIFFGAEKVILFNYSISAALDDVLKVYVDEGKLEIIPWHIDEYFDVPDTHYYGQLVAANDCVYRNKGRSKFVVNTDLDEVIVPQSPFMNWVQMVDGFNNVSSAGIYLFAHYSIKHIQTGGDPSKPLMFSEANLKNNIAYRSRPKMIIRTDAVECVAIHIPKKLAPGYVIYKVPVDLGKLYHFPNHYIRRKTAFTIDTIARFREEFQSQILRRISRIIQLEIRTQVQLEDVWGKGLFSRVNQFL